MKMHQKQRIKIIKSLQKNKFLISKIYNLKLFLNKLVLVPHINTLILTKIAVILIKRLNIKTIADLGTGSGFIAIKLAKTTKLKKIFATDIDPKLLKIARINSKINFAHNIVFRTNKDKNHWLKAIPESIDLLISNPPYIGDDEFFDQNTIRTYPETILDPPTSIRTYDKKGIKNHKNIIEEFEKHNSKILLLEINNLHKDLIELFLNEKNFCKYHFIKFKDKYHFLVLLKR